MNRFLVTTLLLILPLYGISRAAQELVKGMEPYRKDTPKHQVTSVTMPSEKALHMAGSR